MAAALPFETAVGPVDRRGPAHDVGSDGRFFQRIVQSGIQVAGSGADHAQIQAAQLSGEAFQRRTGGGRIHDVGRGVTKTVRTGGRQFLQQRLAPPGHADPVSFGRKAFGQRPADTGSGPDDNRSFHGNKVNGSARKKR